MEFQFWVPKNVRLPAHISQQSNLKYIKTVMDHLDDRLRTDFRNSYLGFLVEVLEIQFSAQVIQALVCRGICYDKSHELWFNVQGHLTQFGLQEYAIVTGLHAGSFSEGDRYTKVLEKRRLKEKYFKLLEKISCAQLEKTFVHVSTPRADRYKLRLALIVEGVITASDNNVDDLELFFPTPGLKSVVEPQFHEAAPASGRHDGSAAGDGHDDESGVGVEDDETSVSDDRPTPEGNGDDGSKADESGDSSRNTSSETGAGDTEDDEDASRR
ncbi:Hypothetical predicted protein [Olea europaea subsp. europaea]|uniref:DUF1985 domain-containing protein n=1 Tax=Olea europaea subsp. europaea TaxID=158383 RepID=A0A8S0TKZ9_OLEEU|nr:Hypothetical predicted protein [Olea europaea subsp. europaea]